MKFEDNIDKILIISLGENKNLWKHIDKIYYENEVKYFEAYLNERDKYKKEKSKGTKSKFSLFFMDYWSLRSDRYRRCSLC